MQNETVLERFKKFKSMILSADVPSNILLDMVEKYITQDDDDSTVVESVPVLDGQLTLYDCELCA